MKDLSLVQEYMICAVNEKGGIPSFSTVAEVISVGPGGMVDGKEIVMTVKPGDKVITDKYAGSNVKIGDEEFTIVRLNDILAIVD